MNVIAALVGLAATAVQQEEMYQGLALGDRVEITFKSGSSITGKLANAPRPPNEQPPDSVDYVKEKALTIDVSLEYPGLSGTMTVRKDQIKSLRRLDPLSEEDRKRLEEEKRRLEKELAKRNPAPAPAPAPPAAQEPPKPDPAAAEAKKREEQLKAGEALYKKFPPPDWDQTRENAIKLKLLRRQVPSLDEQEFHKSFELWDLYRRSLEEKKPAPKKD